VECVQEPYFRVECVAITKSAEHTWTSREILRVRMNSCVFTC